MFKPWVKSILLMELKNIMAYRFEFWATFLGRTLFSFILAYFLWKNIFETQALTTMQGYTFSGMILYYLLAPNVVSILEADSMGLISREIYEGSLNKYLIYPVNLFGYKYLGFMVRGATYLAQLMIVLLIFYFTLGFPHEFQISLKGFFYFLCSLFFAAQLNFFIATTIELIAYWADNIWSLRVLSYLIMTLLGGVLIPIDFFPEKLYQYTQYLPYESMIYRPIQFLLGKQHHLFGETILILLLWTGVAVFINQAVFKKGNERYTGVGM